MSTISSRCTLTGLSVSFAYKSGCRCADCRANKAKYTVKDSRARERSRLWRLSLPEDVRKEKDKRKVSQAREIRESKYLQLREQFGSNCNICGAEAGTGMSYNSRALHLDHCHKTGKIRGLLCGSCNVGLGHFKDNVDTLYKAIQYLNENGDVYTGDK